MLMIVINYDSRIKTSTIKVNEGSNKLKIIYHKGSQNSKVTIHNIKLVGTS